MQFKYPELLWGLFLLLIPIFIHFFQLRRFKKTPFTNVKLLQKVVSESRQSSTLKKWLLLFTRMLLLTALIIAFAQPFFAEKTAMKEKETVIYLDDSFSMQAKTENTTLLADAVQNLIKAIPEDKVFHLFTNTKVFRNVTLKDLQNDLLTLAHTSRQLQLNEIHLKANTFFTKDGNSIKNMVVISDFQQRMAAPITDSIGTTRKHLVKLSTEGLDNISVDSVYVKEIGPENIELTALLSSNLKRKNIPVSLLNGEKLIAKTSAAFAKNKKARVDFTLPKNEMIKGKIEISDTGLSYDNQLYFNIGAKEKIKVLAINNTNSDFLKRIFTKDEFRFLAFDLKNLNYGDLNDKNLIVLNELKSVPNSLASSLRSFTDNGGSMVVIPSAEIDFDSYNALLTNYSKTLFTQHIKIEKNIMHISFSDPLYKNVFEKKVMNFQYPKVSQFYGVKTNAPSILSFQDKEPFLLGRGNVFVFTASIADGNSNFKNSPLIVPTFHNMGANSLKSPDLYTLLGNSPQIDVSLKLKKDHILKVTKGDYEFIPQQKSFANKVSLSFNENPNTDGIYTIWDDENPLKNLSFNYARTESDLSYINMADLNATTKNESIASLFQQMQKDSTVNELWKWFVIFALLFMMAEVLIQKYL